MNYSPNDARDDLMTAAEQLRAAAQLVTIAGYSRHSLVIPVYDGTFSVWTAVLTACDGVEPRAEDLMRRLAGTLLLSGGLSRTRVTEDPGQLVTCWESLQEPDEADAAALLRSTANSLESLAMSLHTTGRPY